jgi:transcriptional regulator of acetoin/glycerol metabolism
MLNRIDENLKRAAEDLLSERIPMDMAKDHFAHNYLEAALRVSNGNVSQAARILGVHRNTVHSLLKKVRGER